MVPHELSLVVDKELVRARFMADPEAVMQLGELFSEAELQLLSARVDLQNLQVRRLDTEDIGTASQWVLDVSFETGFRLDTPTPEGEEEAWGRWNALFQCAQEVDAALQEPGAQPTFMVVEFVWENGGGDDNAFTQGFWVNKAASDPLNGFEEVLNDIQDQDGHFYDVTWLNSKGLDVGISLDGLAQRFSGLKAKAPKLLALVSSLRALERAHQLDEQLPPSMPKRSGPRF